MRKNYSDTITQLDCRFIMSVHQLEIKKTRFTCIITLC